MKLPRKLSLAECRMSWGYWARSSTTIITLSRESGNRQAEASSLNNLGATYFGIAYWQKALEYYSQAIPHLKALGNQRGEANTLNNIGVAYNMLGEQQKALEHLQQSLLLRRSTSDRNGEAYTLSNIGSAYSRYGEHLRRWIITIRHKSSNVKLEIALRKLKHLI